MHRGRPLIALRAMSVRTCFPGQWLKECSGDKKKVITKNQNMSVEFASESDSQCGMYLDNKFETNGSMEFVGSPSFTAASW